MLNYSLNPIVYYELLTKRKMTARDKTILVKLLSYKLNTEVLNTLLEYCYKRNGKINLSYAETIAADWKQRDICTRVEALRILDEVERKYNERIQHVQKHKKKDVQLLPDWYSNTGNDEKCSPELLAEALELQKKLKKN